MGTKHKTALVLWSVWTNCRSIDTDISKEVEAPLDKIDNGAAYRKLIDTIKQLTMALRHSILTLALLHQTSAQPNPCRGISDNAFNTIPGTGCKDYVQCLKEEIVSEYTCAGDTVYDMNGQYCNWPTSVTCIDTEPPTPSPTPMPTVESTTEMPSATPSESPSGITVETGGTAPTVDGTETNNSTKTADEEITPETVVDCSTPCQPGRIGFYVWPNTQCKKYAQCDDGLIQKNFDCPDETMFFAESGGCRTVVEDGDGVAEGPYVVQGTK